MTFEKIKKIVALLVFLSIAKTSNAQSISDLYDKTNKSVVLIKTMQPEIYGEGQLKTMVTLEGLGSGFVISTEGDIMTAAHIVENAAIIRVVFSDGEEISAKVIYSYPMADVALIRLTEQKSTPLSVVSFANSDNTKIGEQVFVIGAPYGLGHSLSVGYISGKYSRDNISTGFMPTEFIQTDAAINEGSSGGPLFNMNGEVIGIASFIVSRSNGFQGISFAVTSNVAYELLCEGHPIWLGIDGYFVSATLAGVLNLPQAAGILVQKIASQSLGGTLGLKGGFLSMSIEDNKLLVGGDIILSIGTIPLINEQNLLEAWNYIQSLKEDDFMNITIFRKGKIMELTAKIPKR